MLHQGENGEDEGLVFSKTWLVHAVTLDGTLKLLG